LIILLQGEIMNPDHINFIDSILTVKASGLEQEVSEDLLLPQGKSIAELLHDQKEENQSQKDPEK